MLVRAGFGADGERERHPVAAAYKCRWLRQFLTDGACENYGVSRDLSSRAQKIAGIGERAFEAAEILKALTVMRSSKHAAKLADEAAMASIVPSEKVAVLERRGRRRRK